MFAFDPSSFDPTRLEGLWKPLEEACDIVETDVALDANSDARDMTAGVARDRGPGHARVLALRDEEARPVPDEASGTISDVAVPAEPAGEDTPSPAAAPPAMAGAHVATAAAASMLDMGAWSPSRS